jgi:cytochrome P450
MALQDRPDLTAVTQSLAWLRRAPLREPSAVALALTAIAFQIFGVADDDVEARLAADADRAERLGNLQALAMLLYALTARRHAARAFRV